MTSMTSMTPITSKNILIVTLAGLAIGALSAFSYDDYQSEELKSRNDVLSSQVQQLTSTNEELENQLGSLKKKMADQTLYQIQDTIYRQIKIRLSRDYGL